MVLSLAQVAKPFSPLCPKLFAKALDAHGLRSRYPRLIDKIINGFDIGKNMPTLLATVSFHSFSWLFVFVPPLFCSSDCACAFIYFFHGFQPFMHGLLASSHLR
jgi:hypothetical protein